MPSLSPAVERAERSRRARRQIAEENLRSVLAGEMFQGAVGDRITCREADVISHYLAVHGLTHHAHRLMELHTHNEREDRRANHFRHMYPG